MLRPSLPALFALCLAIAACNRTRPEVATTPASTGDADERARRDSIDRANAERERLERDRQERERAERARIDAMRASVEAPIWFGYDRSDLTAEARATLDAKLATLVANPSVRLMVEGHTDDRGSDEYNLALGQRRAAAAKRYLTQRGIAADRVEIASFGEERPTCQDESEACWARNRRDEFRVSAGDFAEGR